MNRYAICASILFTCYSVGPVRAGGSAYDICILNSNKYSVNVVAFVQTSLKNAGLYKRRIDGKMGPSTQKGIRAYRELKGLSKSDGIDREFLKAVLGPKRYTEVQDDLPRTEFECRAMFRRR